MQWFCFKNGADCTDHKVKCLQYERALNDHKGATKKKIQLANKFFTLPELIELLKIWEFHEKCKQIIGVCKSQKY